MERCIGRIFAPRFTDQKCTRIESHEFKTALIAFEASKQIASAVVTTSSLKILGHRFGRNLALSYR